MKRDKGFWARHWLEHFIILLLVFLIGLTLLFCRRCQEQDYSGALDRVNVSPRIPPIVTDTVLPPLAETEPVVPIEEEVIVDRRRDAGGGCGEFCVTLAWQSVDDLDLLIRQPNGRTISVYKNDTRSDVLTGGMLDVDANLGNRLTTAPVENITWRNPLVGNYAISVKLYQRNSSLTSMPFTLLLKGPNGNTRELTGRVSNQSTKQTFNISYPF